MACSVAPGNCVCTGGSADTGNNEQKLLMFGEVLQQGKTNKGVHHLCICNLTLLYTPSTCLLLAVSVCGPKLPPEEAPVMTAEKLRLCHAVFVAFRRVGTWESWSVP